ncbi:MAG: formate dehydrogenase subunit delta [Acidimicrobiales bacterium]|jgi:hypothetical protein
MATADLVRMANQIAANFGYLAPADASAATAAHITSFWPLAMRHEFCADVPDDELEPVARAAKSLLQQAELPA